MFLRRATRLMHHSHLILSVWWEQSPGDPDSNLRILYTSHNIIQTYVSWRLPLFEPSEKMRRACTVRKHAIHTKTGKPASRWCCDDRFRSGSPQTIYSISAITCPLEYGIESKIDRGGPRQREKDGRQDPVTAALTCFNMTAVFNHIVPRELWA